MSAGRKPFSADPPRVLSIAGSDPSGGAGIQADLKTFSSIGCYGLSVLTSLTAQNTTGVTQIHVPPVDFFRSQLRALWEDVQIDAIKIGMLGNRDVILALSEELSTNGETSKTPIVLDPVMVSTSGSLLLTRESIEDLIKHLLPLCTLLTPNLPEAKELLSHSQSRGGISTNSSSSSAAASSSSSSPFPGLSTVEALLRAAKDLCSLGPKATLVKGGHQKMESRALQDELNKLGLVATEELEDSEKIYGAEAYRSEWQGSRVILVRTDGEPYADILRRWSKSKSESSSDTRSSQEQEQQQQQREIVLDVLYDKMQNEYTLFVKPHIHSTATHGTGCTLSSALAAYLSGGESLARSAHLAIRYVQQSISRGLTQLGKGSGPLNHLCHITPRPVLAPAASSVDASSKAIAGLAEQVPLCSRLIAHSLPLWRAFTRHPFLQQLGDHSLPAESFIYFLKQDYLFLRNYARVWASGASSFAVGNTFPRIAMFAGIAAEMAEEADNHVEICKPWGITKHDLDHATVESIATLAYTRFVLDISRSGDALELLAATGPCLLGYGEVGLYLANSFQGKKKAACDEMAARGYEEWMEYYSGRDFQEVVRKGIENMEEYASSDPPSTSRLESLQRIWNAAIRLEIGMWDEAIHVHLRRGVLDP